VQGVSEDSGKLGYAITFAASVAGSGNCMKNAIEYYSSEQIRKQSGRWIAPEQRAKITTFPTSPKKSTEHQTAVQRRGQL